MKRKIGWLTFRPIFIPCISLFSSVSAHNEQEERRNEAASRRIFASTLTGPSTSSSDAPTLSSAERLKDSIRRRRNRRINDKVSRFFAHTIKRPRKKLPISVRVWACSEEIVFSSRHCEEDGEARAAGGRG